MTASGKKPGVAFWATVVLVAIFVVYPLSFVPACWISSRVQPSGRAVSAIYRPVIHIWCECPESILEAILEVLTYGNSTSHYYVRHSHKGVDFKGQRRPRHADPND
jgi:hypothetical protein